VEDKFLISFQLRDGQCFEITLVRKMVLITDLKRKVGLSSFRSLLFYTSGIIATLQKLGSPCRPSFWENITIKSSKHVTNERCLNCPPTA